MTKEELEIEVKGSRWIELARKLRSDLTDEQKLEAARIGRIQFTSAGATRKR